MNRFMEGEMRTFVLSGLAAAFLLSLSPAAVAQPSANQVSDAIALCRDSIAEQTHTDVDHVRLDQVRQRTHSVTVDIDLWRDGRLTNVRCEVARGETLTIASITPALGVATAQR